MAVYNLTSLNQIFPLPEIPTIPIANLTTPGLITLQGGSPVIELGAVTITKGGLGSNPSGAIKKQCVVRRLDKIVFLYFFIEYAVAGIDVRTMSVALPPEAPVPWAFDNWPNDSWVYPGEGGILASANDLANATGQAGIYKDASGNLTLRLHAGVLALAGKFGYGTVFYLTGA